MSAEASVTHRSCPLPVAIWSGATAPGRLQVAVTDPVQVDAGDRLPEVQVDVELAVTANRDPDRPTIDRVFGQRPVHRHAAELSPEQLGEPDGSVRSRDDPVGKRARSQGPLTEGAVEGHAPDLRGAPLREPQGTVGAEREAEGQRVGRRDLELGDVTRARIETGDRIDALLGHVQDPPGGDDASLGNGVGACGQRVLDDRPVRRQATDVARAALGDPDGTRRVRRQPARDGIDRRERRRRQVVVAVEAPDGSAEADVLAARPGRDAERRRAGGNGERGHRPLVIDARRPRMPRWRRRDGGWERKGDERRCEDRPVCDPDHVAHLVAPGARLAALVGQSGPWRHPPKQRRRIHEAPCPAPGNSNDGCRNDRQPSGVVVGEGP